MKMGSRLARSRWWLVLMVLTLAPSPALALLRAGFGADYWFNRGGEFNFTLAAHASLTRAVSAGARFGVLVATDPATAGIPLDLQLRAKIPHERLYFEFSAGPWILFVDSPVRAHVGFGFGLDAGVISFGLEVGWLDPNALMGLRLGIKF
jgi:hypothetical protein